MGKVYMGSGNYKDTKYSIDDVVIFKDGTAEKLVVGVITNICIMPDDKICYDIRSSPYSEDDEDIEESNVLCKLYDTAMVCIQHIKS